MVYQKNIELPAYSRGFHLISEKESQRKFDHVGPKIIENRQFGVEL